MHEPTNTRCSVLDKPLQDLLQWLDALNSDLADEEGGHVLEEELQRAVETALRVQAQNLADSEAQSERGVQRPLRAPRQHGRQH